MSDQKWIIFDAVGTLFEPAEPVEYTYADVFSKHGFGLPAATWKAAFGNAFLLTPDPTYPPDADANAIEKEWWRDLVRRTAEATGIRPDPASMARAFETLYEHYATGSAWKLFPETTAVLKSLRSKGIGLAIATNFDARIHSVLAGLGITEHFDHILTSAEVRARKPSPLILKRFMEATSTTPARCCLAGDSPTADKGAAEAAGIPFHHIHRPTIDLTSLETRLHILFSQE